VEIHQSGPMSSDISFDLELVGTAYPPNQPPTVDAGLDQSVTLPGTASLSGTAADDGLPIPPGQLTVTWSKVSGPGTVAFASPNAVNTTAAFSSAGVYVLRVTATDGAVPVSDTVSVIVNGGTLPELRVYSIALSPDGSSLVRIRFTAVAGQSYTVQFRDSLSSGGWSKLSDVPAPVSTGTFEVTDGGMSASASRYYRIVSPQQP